AGLGGRETAGRHGAESRAEGV
ncbi:MAG: hypothetical protein AVDCRST_MAG90-2932, partial [uncultured Microvirga sp.]